MKCEKCGKNEANYYYKETINGKTSEKHLCTDCAGEEGLLSAFDWQPEKVFDDFFGDFFDSRGSLFDSFFGTGLPRLARTMLRPALTLPRVEIGRIQPEEKPASVETGIKIAPEVNEELRLCREKLALKEQLAEAVRNEDYERAIELRDKLKALNGN